jgi:hypothetical protein
VLASLGMDPGRIRKYLFSRWDECHFRSSAAFIEKLAFVLNTLHIPRRRVCVILATHPCMLDYSLESTMRPRLQLFMEYWRTADPAGVGVAVSRNPRLLWVRRTLHMPAVAPAAVSLFRSTHAVQRCCMLHNLLRAR